MSPPLVRGTTPRDERSAIDTVVLAFATDPVARWCWPDARHYLSNMPDFTRAFGGRAFSHGAAHCTDDGAGAALWLPPDVHPDETAIVAVLERTASPSLLADLHAVFEKAAAFHPEGPHWYLPLIAVDPMHQGKGHGSALLTHALAQCDRDRLPAYLESTNPRNVSLYERHGFEVLGTIQVGQSPPLVPMLRRGT
jgi:ribosomal protein S18 acetylase RimI-like enzyme